MKCEDLEKVVVGDDPEKFFQIGAQMPLLEKEQLVDLLRRNVNVFAWDAYEAPRVDPNFIFHHLNVNLSITQRRQPPRHLSKKHVKAVKNEVTKLKLAGAIQRGILSSVVGQHSSGEKENRKMVCVCGLYRSQ